MTEYRVPGLEEDDGITFEADDRAAEEITFAWLITLGRERAERGAWVCVDADEEVLDEFSAPGTAVGEHHRWAWDFARKCLTNYDAILRRLMQPGPRRPCDRCHPVEHETARLLGSLAKPCPLCDDCIRQWVASLKALRRRLDLLDAAVAAWARAHWPELEIRESCPGAIDDALDEIQESVIVHLQAQRGPLH